MDMIATTARNDDLVCIRSTVPIGATRQLAAAYSAQRLLFAACPDRSLAGRALSEQFELPHLIGGLDNVAGDLAVELFAALAPTVRVRDPETAEAIKLFANLARDMNFALANQFALICEAVGIATSEVRAAGGDGYPRFRPARPGPAGGPCLTKDLYLLAASEGVAGLDLGFLGAGRAVNQNLAAWLAGEIVARTDARPGPVAVLGMAFKGIPATADHRNGFGGELVAALRFLRPGLVIRTWDPVAVAGSVARRTAVHGATVVVLANDHPDLASIMDDGAALAPRAVVYDMTGVLPRGEIGPGLEVRRFGDGGYGR